MVLALLLDALERIKVSKCDHKLIIGAAESPVAQKQKGWSV